MIAPSALVQLTNHIQRTPGPWVAFVFADSHRQCHAALAVCRSGCHAQYVSPSGPREIHSIIETLAGYTSDPAQLFVVDLIRHDPVGRSHEWRLSLQSFVSRANEQAHNLQSAARRIVFALPLWALRELPSRAPDLWARNDLVLTFDWSDEREHFTGGETAGIRPILLTEPSSHSGASRLESVDYMALIGESDPSGSTRLLRSLIDSGHADEALALARDDLVGIPVSLRRGLEGCALLSMRKWRPSLVSLRAAVDAARTLGENALWSLLAGDAARRLGDDVAAEAAYTVASAVVDTKSGSRSLLMLGTIALTRLGDLALVCDRVSVAKYRYEHALHHRLRLVARDLLDPSSPEVARMYERLSIADYRAGRASDALKWTDAALSVLSKGAADDAQVAAALVRRSRLMYDMGEFVVALESAAALSRFLAVQDGIVGEDLLLVRSEALEIQGDALFLLGKHNEANKKYNAAIRALAGARTHDACVALSRALRQRGALHLSSGARESALADVDRAMKEIHSIAVNGDVVNLRQSLAELRGVIRGPAP